MAQEEIRNTAQGNGDMPFVEHLEELRRMLFRILGVMGVAGILVFSCKDAVFHLLMAPGTTDFVTYRYIEHAMHSISHDFHFEHFAINIITTQLGSQFMMHISVSIYVGLLAASPYILYELFRFVSPALYERERRYASRIVVGVYLLFIVGVLTTYFVLFPFSVRFLSTYSVSDVVTSSITLESYVESFFTLTLLMGLVFQLPIISFSLAKMGVLTYTAMQQYRKHAFILIMIVAAVITPPDIMTLLLVTLPVYMLYEGSIWVCRLSSDKQTNI